uniref:Cytochrome P450 n=1 Tax=Anopheles maculatus TaxID=74869 RepID=A0A182TBD6_9DIPT
MFGLYVALIVLAVCLYFKWSCSYWTRRGNVAGPKPLPIFGNLFEQLTGQKHFGEIFEEMYRAFPEASWVGYYKISNQPGIVVRDLELVREVLTSSFSSFNQNDFHIDETIDPLVAYNPFVQAGDRWKERRNQMTSVFTMNRIRATFPLVQQVAQDFVQFIARTRKMDCHFEAKDAMYDNLSENGTVEANENHIVGHSVTFLSEGFETSSTMMSYLLYELASNPAIQDKVVQELRTVMNESDAQLTEAGLHKLVYMEAAMMETLRMHTPTFTLPRICTKDFELPPQFPTDTKRVTLRSGTSVVIPVYAIHYDPEIYPSPYVFDPERFLEENRQSRPRHAFLGFGEGPRLCLGKLFSH